MSDPVKYNPEQVIDKVEPILAYAEYDGWSKDNVTWHLLSNYINLIIKYVTKLFNFKVKFKFWI